MKVISNTKTGYLVDVTVRELTELVGDNKFVNYHSGYKPDIDLGVEIKVGTIYQQAIKLTRHLDELTKTQILLRNMADNIEPIKPLIENICKSEDTDE